MVLKKMGIKATINTKMDAKIDYQSIKKELHKLYDSFVANPNDEELKTKAITLEKTYSGLIAYADLASKEIIPKNIYEALINVTSIYQYGMFDDNHPAFSKEKIMTKAKEILQKL